VQIPREGQTRSAASALDKPESGQEQDRAYPECGAQSEVVGKAAQEVGGGDDERAGE
jgi:hypothetical protein